MPASYGMLKRGAMVARSMRFSLVLLYELECNGNHCKAAATTPVTAAACRAVPLDITLHMHLSSFRFNIEPVSPGKAALAYQS